MRMHARIPSSRMYEKGVIEAMVEGRSNTKRQKGFEVYSAKGSGALYSLLETDKI